MHTASRSPVCSRCKCQDQINNVSDQHLHLHVIKKLAERRLARRMRILFWSAGAVDY
jgi:hypothetical protein